MRFIPALLVCLFIVAPLSPALEPAPAENGLPLSLDELKLNDVGWKFPLTEYSKDACLVWALVDGADLFVLDSANTLHCLEAERGVHRWIMNLPGQPTQPLGLSGDMLGICIKDRLIIAKRKNGARILDKELKTYPATAPAVTDKSAYLGVMIQNRLTAVDAATGITGWSYRFRDSMTAAPKLYGDGSERYLYAAAHDGMVVALPPNQALSIAPSRTAWSLKTRGRNSADFIIKGQDMYVVSEDTSLYALNRLTGGIKWKHYTGIPLKNPVQVASDHVFLNTGESFLCIQAASGTLKWSLEEGVTFAAVIKDKVYVTRADDSLIIVDLASGKLFKEVVPDDGVCMVPNTASEMLIVASGTNLFGIK